MFLMFLLSAIKWKYVETKLNTRHDGDIQNLLRLKLDSFALITLVLSSCFIFPILISLTWSWLSCDINI